MEYLKIWDDEMPLYDKSINNEQNKNINRITFFSANMDQKVPTVVIFPGGGYSMRASEHEGLAIAGFFASQGFNAAVVEYRVAPYRYPAALLDAQRAIKVLRYNAERLFIDENKIVACGFSAGGHLCGMTATKPDICNLCGDEIDKMSCSVNGAILAYAVCSSDEKIGHMGSFYNLVGENNKEKFCELSNELNVTENTCPCFIWHTVPDPCVNVKNSIVFAQKLIDKGVKCELHLYPVGHHGQGLGLKTPHITSWAALAAKWITDII